MSSAVIGLAGVVVGGLLTAGLQALDATRSRRRAARGAARILSLALFEAVFQLEQASDADAWCRLDDFSHATAAYERVDVTAMAQGLHMVDFAPIGLAFSVLRHLDRIRAHNRERAVPDQGFALIAPRLEDDRRRVQAAATIAWRMGQTARDRSEEGVARKRQLEAGLGIPPGCIP